MQGKEWCAPAVVALGAVAALVAASAAAPARPAPVLRPNVVVLMTDDQTLESMKVLPNTKRLLGAAGTTFANSYVSFSLCCPSRATFLTGQFAHNHGVLDNEPPEGGYSKLDNSNTLPVWLHAAGYRTGFVGKYLNSYGSPPSKPTEIPPGWDDWHANIGATEAAYFDYTLNENGRLVSYGHDDADYHTDVVASRAVDVIRKDAAGRSPFFLWVAFLAPHAGTPVESRDPTYPPNTGTPVAAPRDSDRFRSLPLPRTPSFDEADVSDKPRWVRYRPRIDDRLLTFVEATYRQRLESLLAVDRAVSRIVAALRETSELSNTILVFTSDNGFFQGEHRITNGKILPYEAAIRVPLLMRGPGIAAGRTLSQPVENVDLAPTILALTRAKPGRVQDGRSLLPLLRDPGIEWGRDLFLEAGPRFQDFDAIRTPRFLDARYTSGEDEFYDLALDPDELVSRHADPAYAQLRAETGRRIERLKTCAGRSCFDPPALKLSVSYARGAGGCVAGPVRARVAGADTRWLVGVNFAVAHRQRARTEDEPWATRLQLAEFPRGRVLIRARAVLRDGRVMTLDTHLTRC